MGLRSRQKGKRGERAVATLLRQLAPEAVVRRTSQAESAHNADVIVNVGPAAWRRLWIEVTDSRHPDPKKKLAQAERDAPDDRWPVVIWHRTGERTWWATLRAGVLVEVVFTVAATDGRASDLLVTLDARALLVHLRGRP